MRMAVKAVVFNEQDSQVIHEALQCYAQILEDTYEDLEDEIDKAVNRTTWGHINYILYRLGDDVTCPSSRSR